jgi:hypothetical protein
MTARKATVAPPRLRHKNAAGAVDNLPAGKIWKQPGGGGAQGSFRATLSRLACAVGRPPSSVGAIRQLASRWPRRLDRQAAVERSRRRCACARRRDVAHGSKAVLVVQPCRPKTPALSGRARPPKSVQREAWSASCRGAALAHFRMLGLGRVSVTLSPSAPRGPRSAASTPRPRGGRCEKGAACGRDVKETPATRLVPRCPPR